MSTKNTRKINKRLPITLAVLGFACGLATPAEAQDWESLSGQLYGLTSIAASHALRLNLINTAKVGMPDCQAEIRFLDANGVVQSTSNQVLAAGNSFSLDQRSLIDGNELQNRMRPVVRLKAVNPNPNLPVDPCRHQVVSSLELIDTISGLTVAAVPATHSLPGDPYFGGLNLQPVDPCRLNVVNTAESKTQAACRVTVGFADGSNAILQQTTVALLPGQSFSAQQFGVSAIEGHSLVRPFVHYAPVEPCRGIASMLEAIDGSTGLTRYFISPNAIDAIE
jgi:hypothetical protein